MSINISIEKKDLWFISAVLVFLAGAGLTVAVWNQAEHPMSHNSADVKVTIAGADYSLQEALDSNLLTRGPTNFEFVTGSFIMGSCQNPRPACAVGMTEVASFCDVYDFSNNLYRWVILCGNYSA